MSEELLDLNTVLDRDTIAIKSKRYPNGKAYELLNVQELGVLEHAKILAGAAAADRLAVKAKKTPKDQRQLRLALTESVRLIAPTIEPAVMRDLNNAQLERILITWGHRASSKAGGEGNPRSGRKTSDSRSPASKRSTAAIRKRGSAPRSSS